MQYYEHEIDYMCTYEKKNTDNKYTGKKINK